MKKIIKFFIISIFVVFLTSCWVDDFEKESSQNVVIEEKENKNVEYIYSKNKQFLIVTIDSTSAQKEIVIIEEQFNAGYKLISTVGKYYDTNNYDPILNRINLYFEKNNKE